MPLWEIDNWVPLGDLFVDVNILKGTSSNSRSELDDLWKDFTAGESNYRSLDRIGLGKQKQRVSGLAVLERNKNLMVVGKPGSGKTTYLQRIVTECNNEKLQVQRIPVLIKLREFVDDGRRYGYNLELFFGQLWRLSSTDIELVLSQGRALVLLDGLDEVTGEAGKQITREIKRFTRVYPQVLVVVTCRTQSQESRFDRFDYVEVADFNEEQVRAFAEHWFDTVCGDGGENKAREFLEQLFREENKPIRELAITPILLSLTCAVFQQTGQFYSKRSKLYEEGLELLLVQWDKSREVARDEVYRDLSVERKLELLSYVAVKKFEQEQYVLFEQEELEEYIGEFLGIERQESQGVLRAIASVHGLLIERSYKVWSFSHLTFQEYCIAREFINNCNREDCDNLTLEKLFNQIFKKNWREVFILTIEAISNSDKFLLLMKEKIDNFLDYDKHLQNALGWINYKSSIFSENINSAGVRAYYLMLLTNKRIFFIFLEFEHSQPFEKFQFMDSIVDTFTRISKDCNNISLYNSKLFLGFNCHLDLQLPIKLLEGKISKIEEISKLINEEDIQSRVKVIKAKPPANSHQIIDDLSEQRNILEKWWIDNCQGLVEKLYVKFGKNCRIINNWNFNDSQQQMLGKYYYANLLLVDCLNSNCNISKGIYHKIKDSLFLPVTEIEKHKRENIE